MHACLVGSTNARPRKGEGNRYATVETRICSNADDIFVTTRLKRVTIPASELTTRAVRPVVVSTYESCCVMLKGTWKQVYSLQSTGCRPPCPAVFIPCFKPRRRAYRGMVGSEELTYLGAGLPSLIRMRRLKTPARKEKCAAVFFFGRRLNRIQQIVQYLWGRG